jgi:hydrogenase large subunit
MSAIDLNSLATMNMDRWGVLQSLFQEMIQFVQQAYFVDACLLAASYPERFPLWTRRGELSCGP